MSDRLRQARHGLPALLLGVVFLVLVVWLVLEIRDVHDRLRQAQQDGQTLAQQVRDLGGTPKVTPSPGPAGRAGQPGQPGRAGASGQPGRSGSTGPSGKPGSAGASGPPGTPGSPGTAGQPGEQGPAGPPGKDGADGKDGTDGKDGSPPSSWTWTYLGVTYICTPTSEGATTYTCEPDGVGSPASNSRR